MKKENFMPVKAGFIFVFFALSFSGCSLWDNSGSAKRDFGNNDGSSLLHPLGAKPISLETIKKAGMYVPPVTKAVLPPSVDLSGYMPPVGNQGIYNSCVGWAVGYALKTYQERLEEGWDQTNTTHRFSPSWVYNQINQGVDNGADIQAALQLIVSKGCDTWADFPYSYGNYTNLPNEDSMQFAMRYKASSWSFLTNDLTSLKTLLAAGKAVPFTCMVRADLDNLCPTNMVYDSTNGTARGTHALCLVGYDDTLQAFKFINSWGSDWGIQGYGWISYKFITNYGYVYFTPLILFDDSNVNTIYVAKYGNDIYAGKINYPVKSIRTALQRRVPAIYIGSGIYYENLRISYNNLWISGGWNSNFTAKSSYAYVDGSGNKTSTNGPLLTAVKITNLMLEGFVFQNNVNNLGTGCLNFSNLLYSVISNTSVQYCTNLNYNNGGGIVLRDSGYDYFNILLYDNLSYSGGGMYCYKANNIILKGSISHNYGYTGGGIVLSGCSNFDIYSAIQYNFANNYGGIYLSSSTNITLQSSSIVTYNTNGGICIPSSSDSNTIFLNGTAANNYPYNVQYQ